MTVQYVHNKQQCHHTVAAYMELTSAGKAQDKYLENAFAYLSDLLDILGDPTPFDETVFAASMTDRGASLGRFDKIIERLFEPAHRLALAVNNVLAGYDALGVVRVALYAAAIAAYDAAFQEWLCQQPDSPVRYVSGFLWQQAESARFSSSLGVCYVLSQEVAGKTMLEHVVDFLKAGPSLLQNSTSSLPPLIEQRRPPSPSFIENTQRPTLVSIDTLDRLPPLTPFPNLGMST
eukprot:Hpha_TRINITY_DN16339_c3_g1::TRINITY_DN16339_c3_g1_i1::g.59002::m.59002